VQAPTGSAPRIRWQKNSAPHHSVSQKKASPPPPPPPPSRSASRQAAPPPPDAPQQFDSPATPDLPPPPPAPSTRAPAPEKEAAPAADTDAADAPKPVSENKGEKYRRLLRTFFSDGFFTSLAVHAVLIVIAMLWVVSTLTLDKEITYTTFQVPSGGGDKGSAEFKKKKNRKQARDISKNLQKLSVKSSSSRISIPQIPPPDFSSLQINELRSDLAKGLGPGSLGPGFGPGPGSMNSFVSFKMVMGLRIEAQNIAVYLDNSGSMTPYLERVKSEIYAQFPRADIFEYDGIRVIVRENTVFMGRAYTSDNYRDKGRPSLRYPPPTSNTATRQPPEKLSSKGKVIWRDYSANFEAGSVGAWMDIMLSKNYDALIVFSDFQDGVVQSDKSGEQLYYETSFNSKITDNRLDLHKEWEEDWLRRVGQAPRGRPKLYLFSIEVQPQAIWQKCVQTSGGAIRMMPELRDDNASF
jgi:hypothetical protein